MASQLQSLVDMEQLLLPLFPPRPAQTHLIGIEAISAATVFRLPECVPMLDIAGPVEVRALLARSVQPRSKVYCAGTQWCRNATKL